jgi:ribosomal protein S18 acetylase RimI-like enzyme
MTPPRITVRPGRDSDADTIIEFNARMALETEDLKLDRDVLSRGVRAALADPKKGRYFVTELHGKVVGQLMVTLEWSDWRNGDIWWVQSVYVDDSARGQGAFKALYRHVQLAAREAGAVGVRLYVEKENDVAQKTYARLGMGMTHYLVMEEMF